MPGKQLRTCLQNARQGIPGHFFPGVLLHAGCFAALQWEQNLYNTLPSLPLSFQDAGRFAALQQEQTLYNVSPSLPLSYHDAGVPLEIVKRSLVEHYQQAEAGAEINPTAFRGIHAVFVNQLTEVDKFAGDVELCPLDGSSKRSQESNVADARVTSPTPQ